MMSAFCIKKRKQARNPYAQDVGSRYCPIAGLTSGRIHMVRDGFSGRILWDIPTAHLPLEEIEDPPHLLLCFPWFCSLNSPLQKFIKFPLVTEVVSYSSC